MMMGGPGMGMGGGGMGGGGMMKGMMMGAMIGMDVAAMEHRKNENHGHTDVVVVHGRHGKEHVAVVHTGGHGRR